jgi:hypothetical protein
MSSKPVAYVGQSVVASWLGVTSAAVSNWIRARHRDTVPVPDVVIVSDAGDEIVGWAPGRREEWEAWRRATGKTLKGPRRHYVTDEDRKDWQ